MESKLLKNKEGHSEDKSSYVKQFPKISVLKLGKNKNTYDDYLVN